MKRITYTVLIAYYNFTVLFIRKVLHFSGMCYFCLLPFPLLTLTTHIWTCCCVIVKSKR